MIKTIYTITRLPVGWRLEQDRGLGWENLGAYPSFEAASAAQQRRIEEAK
jgi:hypothetical protein